MAVTDIPSLSMTSPVDTNADAFAQLVASVIGLATQYGVADEATGLDHFITRLLRDLDYAELSQRRVEDLAGMARALWNEAAHRSSETMIVRAYNPTSGLNGWTSSYTIVEVICDDMPFIVDSISMALDARRCPIEMSAHPIMHVVRDPLGNLREVLADTPLTMGTPGSSPIAESVLHLEIPRIGDQQELTAIIAEIHSVLQDVRAATSDWIKMLASLRKVSGDLARRPPPVASEELVEARALLEWMADHHFTLLGTCEVGRNASGETDVVVESGLGILRDTNPGRISATLSTETTLLAVQKDPERSRVHRNTYLDTVAVRRYNERGEADGEWRCVGLWTSSAYNTSPIDVPMLRHKVASVVQQAGYPANSHAGKDLIAILEGFPRDELFQIAEAELLATALGILQLHERRKVRVFSRQDHAGQFATALVYVPRDRYTTTVRERIDAILVEAFQAIGSEWTVRVTESVLARVHFVLRLDPLRRVNPNVAAIESAIADAIRSWADGLEQALCSRYGNDIGADLNRSYANAFPASYRDEVAAEHAVADVAALEQLRDNRDVIVRLDPPTTSEPFEFTVFASRQLPLSDIMPMLANFGVTVLDEHPYHVATDHGVAWIERFRLTTTIDPDALVERSASFERAFQSVLQGNADDDSFGALVLAVGSDWREVAMLRCYARYQQQIGSPFSQQYLAEALRRYPATTRALIDLFWARFDPDEHENQTQIADRIAAIHVALDDVASLDDDRMLRAFLTLILATTRTNWFQHDGQGKPPAAIAMKFNPSLIAELPKPSPQYEIFVASPRVEGVHLRMGSVARGGLRWSDRREDFRTEILGLVKAQTVKNAVIVPVGAKGGFVAKQLPSPRDRDAWLAEGIEAYKIFVGSLLDLTDNLIDGSLIAPTRMVRYDADDPYLVVAADKGTATFSDIANQLALDRGFWLGDAFASGGSVGYDHKAMGITARGAWESVRAHFRSFGHDVQSSAFTVVGIGDMSGDVFGNGMLQSEAIELVGAFDHRDIFIDPTPNARVSFAERQRLFALPRSSWADYDPALISAGGGIFSRAQKTIALTEPIRTAFAIDPAIVSVTPAELISAMLCAPVDLLWNGGIGTYVKASTERHAEVGDKSNDAVRVDATSLRCRVIGEGGNLGFTQLARIEYALGGGRINTDAIDNSAGVDTSDHEVNLKILLDGFVKQGIIASAERNPLLASMTDEVAALVLRDNYEQNRALALAEAQAASMVDVHIRYLDALSASGRLDRSLEFLPSTDALLARSGPQAGLCSAEFSVLLAYTKNAMVEAIEGTALLDDDDIRSAVVTYFPASLREAFPASHFDAHPLRSEIIATSIVNSMVNIAGSTLTFRMQQETGASVEQVLRAHRAALLIFDQQSYWQAVDGLDLHIEHGLQIELYLESRKLLERATRWLVRSQWTDSPIPATVEFFRAGVRRCAEFLPTLLRGDEHVWIEAATSRFNGGGVPAELARRAATLDSLVTAMDIVETAAECRRAVDDVAAVRAVIGDRLELDWLRDRIVEDLGRQDRWHALARNALREDAYREHRVITAAVLGLAQPGDTAEGAYDRWAEQRSSATTRCSAVIADIRASQTFDLATLTVALRELRSLTG